MKPCKKKSSCALPNVTWYTVKRKSKGNVYSYKISQTDAKTKSFGASALRAKNMAAVTIASLNDKRSFATNNK